MKRIIVSRNETYPSVRSCFCCETSEVLLAFSVPLLIWKMGIVMVVLTAEGCGDN